MTEWSVIDGKPVSLAEIEAAITASAETAACEPSGSKAYVAPAMTLIADADALNNDGEKLPKLLRRALRRQGRINRTIVSAAKTLLEEVGAFNVRKDAGALAKIHEALDGALALNSMARGNEYMRRIRRPQSELNNRINLALETLAGYLTDKTRAMYARTGRTPQLEEALLWHVREAAYRNGLHAARSRYVRRWRTDQFIINRCHIISIRLMCELLSQ
jgi:hypothetical protein